MICHQSRSQKITQFHNSSSNHIYSDASNHTECESSHTLLKIKIVTNKRKPKKLKEQPSKMKLREKETNIFQVLWFANLDLEPNYILVRTH